jgi:hypothetical protein
MQIQALELRIRDVMKVRIQPREFMNLVMAVSVVRGMRDLGLVRENRKDVIAELEDMATLGDDELTKALARCAPRTCAAVEAAHAEILAKEIDRHGFFRDVDGNEWKAPHSLFFGAPEREQAGIANYFPAGLHTVRKALKIALLEVASTPDKRGRKEQHHLDELGTACAFFFRAHFPGRGWKPWRAREEISIHVELADVVFEAAGFPKTTGHLLDILTRRPSPSKRRKPITG